MKNKQKKRPALIRSSYVDIWDIVVEINSFRTHKKKKEEKKEQEISQSQHSYMGKGDNGKTH